MGTWKAQRHCCRELTHNQLKSFSGGHSSYNDFQYRAALSKGVVDVRAAALTFKIMLCVSDLPVVCAFFY